jgi:cobalt-zinc-cadmium efflux system membrane fusion protein
VNGIFSSASWKPALQIAVLILCVFGCGTADKHADEHEEEKHVEDSGVLEITKKGQEKSGLKFAAVREDQITNMLKVSGKVVADESRVVHIRPLAKGRVEKIFVTPGSSVSKGQPLISFDYVELGELQNEYAKARAAAEVTENALKRAEQLSNIGALPRSEYEKRKADHESSLANIKNIEFKLTRYNISPSQLNTELTQSVLTSPSSGVLTNFDAAEGEIVEPDAELFTIADLSRVWVEANVHETDLRLVKAGQKAEIRSDAYPDQVFSGTITKVGDVLDVATRTVKVRCEILNPKTQLKLEMFVQVTIPTSDTRKTLLIPEVSVQEIDHLPVVFVKKDEEHFEKRNIQVGQRSGTEIEVVSGLNPGETLVTDGSFSLKSEFLKSEIGSDEHGH